MQGESGVDSSPFTNPALNPRMYRAMWGVRYASAQAVYPRGTIFTIGITADDSDTCVNPTSAARAPTARSWSG